LDASVYDCAALANGMVIASGAIIDVNSSKANNIVVCSFSFFFHFP
jgi:hypothetical protein